MKRLTLNTLFIYAAILASASTPKPTLEVVAVQKDNVAQIKITGYISEWSESSAVMLERSINEFIENGVQDANIYINSKGGSTVEAAEMYNVIRKLPGELTAIGGAIVGSAGGWLACKFDKFVVRSNTQFMWHKPRGIVEGTYDEVISQAELLKNTEEDYLNTYSQKTGKDKSDLAALWEKGDQWLMGEKIVKEGFADSVLKSEAPITEADVKLLYEIGAPVVPEATVKKQQKDTSMNINPELIGLKADATKEQIEARLKELQEKADEAETLKQDKANAEAAAKEAKIKAILDKGIADKKINAELRPKYEAMLKADFDNTKSIIESLPIVGSISAHLDLDDDSAAAERKDWTFADWQQKDPKGLQKMHQETPDKYEKLFNARYKA